MAGNQGWNHCDCCGRFFSPEKDGILIEEIRSLDIGGNLREEWPVYCGPCIPTEHLHRDS